MTGQEPNKITPTPKPATNDQEVDLDTWDKMVAEKYKVPHSLMKAMAGQESGGNVGATSPTGVKGRYQVTQSTARQYNLDRDDPFQQSVAAAKHLRAQYDASGDIKNEDQRWLKAVGRYYGGPDAVQGDSLSGSSVDGLSNPAEHVKRVAQKWGEMRKAEGGGAPASQPPAKAYDPGYGPWPERDAKGRPYQPVPSDIEEFRQQGRANTERDMAAARGKQQAPRLQGRRATSNVFSQGAKQTTQSAASALSFDRNGAASQTLQDINALNARTPVDPNLRAQSEAYAAKSLPAQLATDAYYGAARGGQQLQQAGQRVIGAGLGIGKKLLSPSTPYSTVDVRPEAAKIAQQRTAQNLENQRRSSGDPLTGEVAAAVPIAAGGTIAASTAGLPGLAAYNAGLEDWQDPKRSALRAAANTVIPVGAAKVVGGAVAPALNRIASPALRTATNIGTEALSGGAANAAQTAAEQQYFDGRVDPNSVMRSGLVGAGLGAGMAAAHGGGEGGAKTPSLEARTRPEPLGRPMVRESNRIANQAESAGRTVPFPGQRQPTEIVNLASAAGASPEALRVARQPRIANPIQNRIAETTPTEQLAVPTPQRDFSAELNMPEVDTAVGNASPSQRYQPITIPTGEIVARPNAAQSSRYRTLADEAKIEAVQAAQAGDHSLAARKWAEAFGALGNLKGQARRGGNPEELTALSGEIEAARQQMTGARAMARKAGGSAGKEQPVAAPIPEAAPTSELPAAPTPPRITRETPNAERQQVNARERNAPSRPVAGEPMAGRQIEPPEHPVVAKENEITSPQEAIKTNEAESSLTPEEAPYRDVRQQRIVERRAQERDAALKGNFGKFGEAARKTDSGKRTALAAHDELRSLLDLPPMPERAKDAAAHDTEMQHTLNALAEMGNKPRSSELDYDTLRGVYRRLQLAAKRKGVDISDDLKGSFKATVGDLLKSQSNFENFITDERVQNAFKALETNEKGQNTRTNIRALKAPVADAAKEHGVSASFLNNWWKQAQAEAGQGAKSAASGETQGNRPQSDRRNGGGGLRATGTEDAGRTVGGIEPTEPAGKQARSGKEQQPAGVSKAKELIGQNPNIPSLDNPAHGQSNINGSYVAVRKSDGQAVAEFFPNDSRLEKINFDKYDLLPASEYLGKLNRKTSDDAAVAKRLASIDEMEAQGAIDAMEAQRQRARLGEKRYSDTPPLPKQPVASRSPYLKGATIEQDGALFVVRGKDGNAIAVNANKEAAIRNAEDTLRGGGDYAIDENGKPVYAPEGEIKTVKGRGKFSIGGLPDEPKGPLAASGLGGLQDAFSRRKKNDTPFQFPELTPELERAQPKQTRGLGSIRAEDLGGKREARTAAADATPSASITAPRRTAAVTAATTPPPTTPLQRTKSNVVGALSLPRALMASADISAPLRQGAILTLPPSQWGRASRAFIRQLRAFSTKQYDQISADIANHPAAETAKEAGLHLATNKLTSGEEDFFSKFAEHIPVVKHSEQAYKVYLDSLRMDTFAKYKGVVDKGDFTPEQKERAYKAAADWINVATGRGSLGKTFDKVANELGTVFFAPRYTASRIQVLNPATYLKNSTTPEGRAVLKQQMADAVQFAGMTAATLALAKAAGAQVSTNPNDPDFLKIRMGRFHYDTLAGLQQLMRLYYRVGADAKLAAEGKESARNQNAFDIAGRFLRSKEAPVASYLHDAMARKTYTGEKFDAKKGAMERMTPLMFRDFYDAYKAEGMSGVAKTTPGLVGVGVQNYTPGQQRKKK